MNIQTASEFDCQRLNRDTWKDEHVRKIIQESFVFWQKNSVRSIFVFFRGPVPG